MPYPELTTLKVRSKLDFVEVGIDYRPVYCQLQMYKQGTSLNLNSNTLIACYMTAPSFHRPAIFFRHPLLITPAIPQVKIRSSFQKSYSIFHFTF